MAFAANGKYIVGGGDSEVRVWRVEDGKQMATLMAASGYVWCLAGSKDGRWIAAGTDGGDAIVWDAKTFRQIFRHRVQNVATTGNVGVDFSPDSTRLMIASFNSTATVLDVATRKKVLSFDLVGYAAGGKYSPQGDRIATAASDSVRVWGAGGRLLVHIPVKATPSFNNGFLWSNNHLFVVSDGTIKQLEPSTGSTVSEWLVPNINPLSCIAALNMVMRPICSGAMGRARCEKW